MATYANIQSKIYFLTKTNSTSFPTSDMLVLANNAMDRVASLIEFADGRWNFDDSNQPATNVGDGTGGLPIATTSLVSGQQDYALSVSFLNIERVELKDESGRWRKLQPIDQADVYDQSITDFMSGGGTPMYYDKIGSSIMLYPTPDYSQANSLKVWVSRPPILILASDISSTAVKPGFNALYHDLIALWVSYDYAVANGLPNANQLMVEIQRKEEALKEDFALRNVDDRLKISAKKYNFN